MGDGNPPETRPHSTSTPIKAAAVLERHLSGKKVNLAKVNAAHLIFEMQDRQEVARKKTEAKAPIGSLLPGLPATLPDLPGGEGIPVMPSNPTPEAPKQGTKHPHDDDNEITELPDEGEPAMPPKKKKKSKDKPMEEVPVLDVPDDGACPSSSTAKPEVVATKPKQAPAPSGIPEGETKVPKKKKKKKKDKQEADLEKFWEQDWAKKWPRLYTRNSSVNRTSGPSGTTGRTFPKCL